MDRKAQRALVQALVAAAHAHPDVLATCKTWDEFARRVGIL